MKITISDKATYYRLYEKGFFGNRARTWNTYQEIIESEWQGMVCMRSRKGIIRKKVRYNIPLINLRREIEAWKKEGIPEEQIAFNQSMPDESLTIQGEVMENPYSSPYGLYLLYSTVKKPMNLALAEKSETAMGLKAKVLLKHFMCPSSYADLEAIFDVVAKEHVIEFSSYSRNVGDIPNRNTVFWEVRKY